MFSWPSFAPPVDVTENERDPPPPPLKPQFPAYSPKRRPSLSLLTRQSSNELCNQIFRLRTPSHVTADDVESLNICLRQDVPPECLVPPDFRDRPFQHEEALENALRELRTPLDNAFGSVLRLPKKQGKDWPRLVPTHAFFLALEEVSHYWDDSKDQYYEVPDPEFKPSTEPENVENVAHCETGNGEEQLAKLPLKAVYKGRRVSNGAHMPEEYLEKAVKGFLDICNRPFRLQAVKKRMPTRLLIRSLRMPIVHNYDVGLTPKEIALARKGRIEGPVMAVHVRPEVVFRQPEQESPTQMEILDFYREIGSLLLLAQKRAREGQKEVLVGAGTWWGQKSRWGGLRGGHMPYESDEEPTLNPATKTKESDVREKMGTEMDENIDDDDTDVIDVPSPGAGVVEEKPSTIPPRKRPKSNPRPKADRDKDKDSNVPQDGKEKKKKPRYTSRYIAMMEHYRSLKLAGSLWDDHITYLQIGKEGEFDDVFVVSAVNCHICLLRMKVHGDYVRWLEKGIEASPEPDGPSDRTSLDDDDDDGLSDDAHWKKNRLYVERTRWYNFFVEEDRIEAMTGLWRILNWLMRPREL